MKLDSDNGILKKPGSARQANSEQEVYPQSTGYPITWSELGPLLKAGHVCLHPLHRPLPTPMALKGLTCSGVIWIFIWVTGECFLPVCLLHLEESENIVTLPAGQQECLPKTCGDQSIPCHRRAYSSLCTAIMTPGTKKGEAVKGAGTDTQQKGRAWSRRAPDLISRSWSRDSLR